MLSRGTALRSAGPSLSASAPATLTVDRDANGDRDRIQQPFENPGPNRVERGDG